MKYQFDSKLKNNSEKILKIVKDIARALIEHKKQNRFVSEQFKHFEIKPSQRVQIEDLLQIFVDDTDQLKDFLKFIIDDFGKNFGEQLEKLSSINLYHRLLECYLYKRQDGLHFSSKNQQLFIPNQKHIEQEIN